jgi:hypothetical protein
MRKLAEKNNLEIVEITNGRNGYPEGIYNAINASNFENFDAIQKFAEKNNLQVVGLHRRDGWSFWENNGAIYNAFEITSDDYGDNYQFINKMDFEEFYQNEIAFFFEEIPEEMDQIESFLEMKKEIFEEIEKMENDENVLTYEGRYYDTIKTKCLSWSEDTHNYIIALIKN